MTDVVNFFFFFEGTDVVNLLAVNNIKIAYCTLISY